MPRTDQRSVRARFERDGFVIIRDVVDADLVREAGGHVEWLHRQHPDVTPEQLGHEFMTDDPFWLRLVSDDRLVDIASIFVGDDIALFASHYVNKPPFTGMPVLWHQDAAYWPLEPMEVVTLWLAVDESTPENGCVRVVPGSHKEQVHDLRRKGNDNVLGSESDVDVDESTAVDIVLQPGDVEVHHPNIMHASNANTSPNRRCGLTIRYIPTSTRIVADEQPYPSAFHLRGKRGRNVYQPRPKYIDGKHYPFADAGDWT